MASRSDFSYGRPVYGSAPQLVVERQAAPDDGPQAAGAGVWVAVGLVLILGIAAAALFVALANARSIDDSPAADYAANIEDMVAAEADVLQKEITQFQNSVQQQLEALKKKAPSTSRAASKASAAPKASAASKAAKVALAVAGVAHSTQLPRAQLFSSSTGNTSGMSRTGVNLANLANHITQGGSRGLAAHAMTDKRRDARERTRREIEDTAYQAAHPGDARKRQSALQNLKNAMHLDHSAVHAKQKEVMHTNRRLQEREHDGGLLNPRNIQQYARMAALAKDKNLHVIGRSSRSRG